MHRKSNDQELAKETDGQMEIKSIVDAVNLGIKHTNNFFRGHNTTIKSQPLPRIFRKKYNERSVIRGFMRIAPGLYNDAPMQTEYLYWLFLMQHHGAPTRLLDWSESILTALFFAVYNQEKETESEDGEVWEISFLELNKMSGLHMPPSNHPVLDYLAREPLIDKPLSYAKEIGVKDIPRWPIAIYPPLFWNRMVSQKSTFTIHPKPISSEKAFPDEAKLTRYLVRAKNKKKIRRELRLIGIDLYTLFPDLDALSKEIEYQYD
jgi:hypothetical protein